MRKIDIATDAKLIGRIDADTPIAFLNFQRLQHFQIAALAAEFTNSRALQHLHERLGGAIQNGNLDRVDVDKNVIDAAGIDRCEEMLRRREQDSLLHQAGGVADSRNVVALSFNGKIVEVRAAKDDARVSRRRKEANMSEDSGVKTHTFSECLSRYGGLNHCPSVR